ncbi:hypothetical protein [Photobacterium sanguinicancri]|uniref:hypothetical protein n=1 Tax=Photobacterium sanguinicancri TaxID=875932 RepID=UPI0021C3AFDB|nr:hypothetical protein [Photobacterium sanguinicancri]
MNIDEIASQYILAAEKLFGLMCSDWTYWGVEFNQQQPHLRYYPDTGNVAISLSERAKNDEIQLRFQLAHEVCHLLYPTMDKDTHIMEKTTFLNEGVSTYFSIFAIHELCNSQDIVNNLKEHNNDYYQSFFMVNELLTIDVDAIKKLRVVQPKLNRITSHDFELADVKIPEELISKLINTFS